ncbi:hypothetical protein LCGC14_0509940 [marine sediment metagenome]|uniref:HTH cro/C1-type domain-containing protein n=1 Tax=marine sediment metagenome TaxID=412755 RepID=A0A0F9V9R6_9ZZZZ
MVTATERNTEPKIDLSAPDPLATVNRSAAARALRIDASNVSRMLTSDKKQRRVPHLHVFYRLARYLGVSLDELYRLLYS